MLVKHDSTYIRILPSCLKPNPEIYQSSSKDVKTEPQKRTNESPKVPISEDTNENLEILNNNVHRTQKQNST